MFSDFILERPLPFLCAAFIFGIVFQSFVWAPFVALYFFMALFFVLAVFNLNKKILFLFFFLPAVFCLGAGVFENNRALARNHIAVFTPGKSKPVKISGKVVTEPYRKKNKTSFLLEAREFSAGNINRRIKGRVLVFSYTDAKFAYGQKVVLGGKLYRPPALRFSKGMNYRQYLARQGIYSILSVSKNSAVIINTGKDVSIKGALFTFKAVLKDTIYKYLSPSAAGIISAIILGGRNETPQFINSVLQRTGTVHILAISGSNIVLVAAIIMIILKMFWVPYRARYIVTILFLILYCLFTGEQISVVRATIMLCVFLIGALLERDYQPVNSLSLAALIILFFNPNQLFDLGFQLSFISVLFIMLFAGKSSGIFPQRLMKFKAIEYLAMGFGVSLAAWLGTLGIIAYNFNLFTPIAVLANLIVVPLFTVIVAASFVFVIFGALIPLSAPFLAMPCELLITLLYKINAGLLLVPGAYFQLPNFPPLAIITYYLLVFLFFNLSFFARKIYGLIDGKLINR